MELPGIAAAVGCTVCNEARILLLGMVRDGTIRRSTTLQCLFVSSQGSPEIGDRPGIEVQRITGAGGPDVSPSQKFGVSLKIS